MNIELLKKLFEITAKENGIDYYLTEQILEEVIYSLDEEDGVSFVIIPHTPNRTTMVIIDIANEGKYECELSLQKLSNDWGEDYACSIDEIKRMDGKSYRIIKGHLEKTVESFQSLLENFTDESFERQAELIEVFGTK